MLTQRQENFCINIFKGMTGHDAYIAAGYSSKQSGNTIDRNACALMKFNKIVTRLAELRAEVKKDSVATVQEREEILTEIARGNLIDYQEAGADGSWINIGRESPNTRAISEITSRTDENDSVVTKVKLHNPVQAIDLLNKMDKIYTDGPVVNVDNRSMEITVQDEETKKLLEEIVEGVAPHKE